MTPAALMALAWLRVPPGSVPRSVMPLVVAKNARRTGKKDVEPTTTPDALMLVTMTETVPERTGSRVAPPPADRT